MKPLLRVVLVSLAFLAVRCSDDEETANGPGPVVPETPGELAADTVSATGARLTWEPVSGADAYRVYRSTDSATGYQLAGTADTTAYEDTGLAPSTVYYYRVSALSGQQESPQSAAVRVTTAAPPAGTLIVTGRTSTTVLLRWASVGSGVVYTVERSADSGLTYAPAGTPDTVVFTDTGLSPSTTYFYRVKATVGAQDVVVAGPLSVRTLPPAPEPPIGLAAVFDGTHIVLTWQPPASGTYDCYRVYRTTTRDSLGRPDTTWLAATEDRARVSRDSTTLHDMPGLASGVYYYTIVSVRVTGTDSVESVKSPAWPGFASCTVGVFVRLTINHGAPYTITNICTLTVEDPGRRLTSVRFTQFSADSVDSAGIMRPLVPADSIAGDIFGQVASLRDAGWLVSTVTTPSHTAIERVPLFDQDDTLNPARTLAMGSAASADMVWALCPGSGEKRVFAEVTYAGGVRDTLLDAISTTAHRIDLSIVRDATWRDTVVEALLGDTTRMVDASVVYGSTVRFRVNTHGDPSIETGFECWLVTSRNSSRASQSEVMRYGRGWILAEPVELRLSPEAASHDSTTVYEFSVDSSTVEGREPLDSLLVGYALVVQQLLTTSYAVNQKAYDSLTVSELLGRGMKQFLVVARFHERYFGDTFTRLLGWGQGVDSLFTFRDVYPAVAYQPTNRSVQGRPVADTTFAGPFDVVLDSLSIADMGGVLLNEVSLVVAHRPASLGWNSSTPPVVALADLADSVYAVYRTVVWPPASRVRNVAWRGIDPAGWPTGEYIVGVAVKDELGNKSYCTADHRSVYSATNPWRIYYQPR